MRRADAAAGAGEEQPGRAVSLAQAAALGGLLSRRGWSVAVAESCTGGLLGATLTAAPGSSAYVRGGVIAYANDLKVRLLGVEPGLLERHGAVSDPVVRAMAVGVRSAAGAEVGIAITGVAGPGASEAKPAGLIFIGVATPDAVRVVRLTRDLGRDANRQTAVREALLAAAAAIA
ncbi:MAG: CinA family protein [Candidatus Dormibacteria bacterium]